MSKHPFNPTMQDIADRLGYCRSTISLALRNHPSIPVETQQLVRQTAEQMGYRPNPMVSALMSQLHAPRGAGATTFALITKFPMPILKRNANDFYSILARSIYDTAEKFGFSVDEFPTGTGTLSAKRLTQIMTSRGIFGAILFPGHLSPTEYPEIDWSQFSLVMVGYGVRNSRFHQIASDYLHDMDLAVAKLKELGYRRIGCAIASAVDESTDKGWSSRYFTYQHTLPPRQRLELSPSEGPHVLKEPFLAWMRKNKPDAVIISDPQLLGWLKAAGYRIPENLGVLNIVQREKNAVSGVDPNTKDVGATAVETLIQQLQTNQKGLPRVPHLVLVKGLWVEGATLRPQS